MCESVRVSVRVRDTLFTQYTVFYSVTVFAHVLLVLGFQFSPQLPLPEKFSSFDDHNEGFGLDEDGFERFRSLAKECVLIPTYFILEGRYVDILANVLHSEAATSGYAVARSMTNNAADFPPPS